jgi:transcriptional regulator GlxA family with amidase domain
VTTYGLLTFDGMEELDLVGPWEVFTASRMARGDQDTVVTVAESGPGRALTCAKGLRITPDHGLDDHPPLDAVLVPGGQGRKRESTNPVVLDWLRRAAATATWTTSVCTGSFVLHAAGLLTGRRAATHWSAEDELDAHDDVTVVRDARYVVDGNVVTAQGVSAGIDMALWLVGALHGPAHSRLVRRYVQYDPAPPYLADTPAG